MERKVITEYQLKSFFDGIIHIKFNDGFVDNCSNFIKLKEYKNKILENFHNVLSTSLYVSKSLNQQHEENINFINKEIEKHIEYYYKRINYITEIQFMPYQSFMEDIYLIKLKDGCIHNLEGPAHILMREKHSDRKNSFYIYGNELSYNDWKNITRRYKIKKLFNNISSSSFN